MHASNPVDPAVLLAEGLAGLKLELAEPRQQTLLAYVGLILKWNRVYNLTSVRNPQQVVTRHILDSLAVHSCIKGPRILDVGSGAGLPGVPLAVANPDWQVVMLDSNAKKTRFIQQAVAELGLANAAVAQARVEEYRDEAGYDTVISRAFSSVENIATRAGALCRPDGRILAMKGVYPLAELESVPEGFTVRDVPRLHVPGLDSERHLVWLEPVA